jgi:hypothetical protein
LIFWFTPEPAALIYSKAIARNFLRGRRFNCLLIVLALAFPAGPLDSIWRLKPEAQAEFQQIGSGASIALMTVVGSACGLAAVGLARNAQWGRRLAIGVLAVNLIGDSLNAWLRHNPKTLIGLPIGGIMIVYLLTKKFSRNP